ncbi:SDR family oxidoreductase [Nocardioides dongxiaopingii]|uniref:SDR family oxidoreductase n=1 Tax=Nocardioides dongxiaopingii TaxID=2576036 RepID=UPI0010C76313|nr:SDR family oxidoreductase [Nocardioides dongxiaopingii]
MTGSVIITGAGPGVSGSLARLLAREGHPVGLVGADERAVGDLAAELTDAGARVGSRLADLTDAEATHAAVTGLADELGPVDVLHFNPSAFREKDPLELTAAELLEDVALGVGALLTVVRAARPHLREGSRITVTGSMAADEPWHRAASLGVQKAGVRNLVHSIDATLRDDGIRAVSVTVRGALSREGAFTPDRVAAAIRAALDQPVGEWRTEIPYSG